MVRIVWLILSRSLDVTYVLEIIRVLRAPLQLVEENTEEKYSGENI
jgi:hypothetical protein